jgi:hypothetical protein
MRKNKVDIQPCMYELRSKEKWRRRKHEITCTTVDNMLTWK